LDYSLAAGVIREAVKLLSPNIDEDVAAHLLWLIGESGDRKQVYVIGQYLTHSQRKVREAAAAALARLRESAGGDR